MAKAAPTKKTTKPAATSAGVKAGAKKAGAKKAGPRPRRPQEGGAREGAKSAPPRRRHRPKPCPRRSRRSQRRRPRPLRQRRRCRRRPRRRRRSRRPRRRRQWRQKAPEKKAPEKKATRARKAAPAKQVARSRQPVVTAYPKPPRKPSTVICPLSGFEVKPDKPNLSPRTIERLRAKLVDERERHVQQADELAAEAEALALRARGRRHPVRRGVGRGRHLQHRARARPAALGVGAPGRRRDRPRSSASRTRPTGCVPRPGGASRSSGSRRCRTPTPASSARRVPNDGGSTGRPVLAATLVVGIVTADQLSKLWAVRELADGPVSIIGDTVDFRLARNTGSAFSLFQAFTPLLALMALAVAFFLVRAVRRTDEVLTVVGLSLVLGGALGNLGDRLFRSPGFMRGAVVDFVHVGVAHVQRRRLRDHRRRGAAGGRCAASASASGRATRWLKSSRSPRYWRGSGSIGRSPCSPGGRAARCRR